MKIRRWGIAGIAAATLFVPALAGCNADGTAEPDASGSSSPDSSASAGTSADKQALLDSTSVISEGNFRYTISGPGTSGSGTVHMPSRSAQVKLQTGSDQSQLSMDLDLIYVEPESWVKVAFGGAGLNQVPGLQNVSADRYLHIDQTKIQGADELTFDFSQVDPAGSKALAEAVVEVERTGEGEFRGTIDLTEAADAGLVAGSGSALLGEQASELPFTAKLDEEDRLTEFAIQLPAGAGAGAGEELKVTYSDYGQATPVQQPAASEVQEAPPALYDAFNRGAALVTPTPTPTA